MKKYVCEFCKKEFESRKGSKSRTPKFCSSKCFGASQKIYKECKFCGGIIDNKRSESLKKRVYCSKECQSEARKNVPLSEDWKKALSIGRLSSEKCKGENLYNWKGGVINRRIVSKNRYYRTKHNIIGKLPIEKLDKILKFQENKCFFCDSDLFKYKAIEHLTPVTKGGDNSVYNLAYSCKSCNSKKGQKTLEEFAIKNRRFDWLEKWENLLISALN